MSFLHSRILVGFFVLALAALVASFFIADRRGGLAPPPLARDAGDYGPAQFDIRFAVFGELPGWRSDDQYAALEAFTLSCAKLLARPDEAPANPLERLGERFNGVSLSGAVADWRAPCMQANAVMDRSYADGLARRVAARNFFESYFEPIEVLDRRTPKPDRLPDETGDWVRSEGLFTGYFEPIYPASSVRTDRFSTPALRRPTDLVEIDLGAFQEDLAGRRIAGRVENGKLVPYPDHQEIVEGALRGKTTTLAWLDPNDLLFLQIQGSGQLRLNDGRTLRIGYSAQNGRSYTAVGKVLFDRGLMALDEISMQTIRTWLRNAEPADAASLRYENESYVFFKTLDGVDPNLGPLGAMEAPLTSERSLAVDRRYHALGAPVWVDIEPIGENVENGERFRRLLIAQDTGGAIRGPIRGDVYWGSGARAGDIAGGMRAQGKFYVLAPRPVVGRLRAAAS